MTARRLTAALAAATLMSAPLLVAPSTGAPEPVDAQPPACPVASGALVQHDQLPVGLDARACDLTGVVVVSGASRSAIPEPGHSVTATALSIDGLDELTVTTAPDGQVTAARHEALDIGPRPTYIPQCGGAAAYRIDTQRKWRPGDTYYINHHARPANISASKFVDAAVRADETLSRGLAPCGGYYETDTVSLSMRYAGSTTTQPDINTTWGPGLYCDARTDGKNVIKFTKMSSPDWQTIAMACLTEKSGSADPYLHDADIAINAHLQYFTTMPSGCSGRRFDLQGILTHEMGHTVGLGHPDDVAQTMYKRGKPCSYSMRSLGRGDSNGLRKLY